MTYGSTEDSIVIRFWPEDGDRARFLARKGGPADSATMCVAYHLGSDFHSCPASERIRRVKELMNLMVLAVDEAMRAMVEELKHGDCMESSEVLSEQLRQPTGEELRARLKEIDRKYTRYSPVVQGGLPSLGKRHS